jgi:anti-sigma B factor antagonist
VLKVFAITGLDKVFEIHPTLDAALAASNDGVRATGEGS